MSKESPTTEQDNQKVVVHVVLKQVDQGDHVISVHDSFKSAAEEVTFLNKIDVENFHPHDGYAGSHYVDSSEVRSSKK